MILFAAALWLAADAVQCLQAAPDVVIVAPVQPPVAEPVEDDDGKTPDDPECYDPGTEDDILDT